MEILKKEFNNTSYRLRGIVPCVASTSSAGLYGIFGLRIFNSHKVKKSFSHCYSFEQP